MEDQHPVAAPIGHVQGLPVGEYPPRSAPPQA
jgi:hypothetical protein